ncbi:hypothetical protein ASE01_12160 [Nocardioides sp. Root190]|uniref:tubulin-like doman-containing protein n=1 Tax=Nocardioides sp. Root190 TaxID=1736488 RepID=UPI0006F5398C|nr:tubulin-like doman-containing protein [Nocardioides sp. Root190]KRB75809.1 hypothetical protein ASE01_12160 [Nocardioides sp. Root190]
MRRFLIVGCGGSGGATIRFIQDQLLADLRPEGTDKLPDAWQFVHIDVPTTPDKGPAPLGSVRDMGGRYLSVSAEGNTFNRTALQLFQASRTRLDMVGGWVPDPRRCTVPVTTGAGQYRAVGRTLTLTRTSDLNKVMIQAHEDLQKPDPWAGLSDRRRSEIAQNAPIVPIVIGSLAGGSGASMFLDVCRILGTIPGIDPSAIGAFLFTSDVFQALPAGARDGVEGNALGAIGDVIAAQTGLSYDADRALLTSLGVADISRFAFARIFPIGSAIGGDGARFGDGTATGIFRGIGRALAALVIGDAGMQQKYVDFIVGNPGGGGSTDTQTVGWGTDPGVFAWGSFGYASLSLGRDRYAEYAAQRLARSAADRLLEGHLDPGVDLPGGEQLTAKVDAQWTLTLSRLGLPQPGQDVGAWFREQAMPRSWTQAETRRVLSDAFTMVSSIPGAAASDWFAEVSARLPSQREQVRSALNDAAYLWNERFAHDLENRVIQQFLDDIRRQGLPYARAVLERLQAHLEVMVNVLQTVPDPNGFDPLALDGGGIQQRVLALKRAIVAAGHDLVGLVAGELEGSSSRVLQMSGARYAAQLLDSFESDVLGPLVTAASNALGDLEVSRTSKDVEAGLAQLGTDVYREWPDDSEVPVRFLHAENEILLTTATEFPGLFTDHVVRSVPGGMPPADAQRQIVSQIIRGEWETQGGKLGSIDIIATQARWRAAVLNVNAETGEPTPRSAGRYTLHLGPAHLAARARLFLERPNEPFAVFRGESIGQYLNDLNIPPAEMSARKSGFAQKFTEALLLARPLVGVDSSMIPAVHPGQTLKYTYVFGNLGLQGSSEVVERIRSGLQADPTLELETVLPAFDAAAMGDATESRIAIFGSYPKYSPIVFSSLLGNVKNQFAIQPDGGRAALWKWKGTRPLGASLPMSAAELRALIAGWYVGRLTGQLRTGSGEQPVIVWSAKDVRWMPLIWPMLTNPSQISAVDWLPITLESYSLAFIQCNRDPELQALQPFRALRSLWDDSSTGPGLRDGLTGFAAERNIANWLQSGAITGADPSPVIADAGALTVEERRARGRDWIKQLVQWIDTDMLQQGTGANTGQLLGRIDKWEELYDSNGNSRVRFLTIAPLARQVLLEIDQILASLSFTPAAAPGLPPSEPPVVM